MASTQLRRSQLGRLLQLMLAVRGDRFPNARQLADDCEVSLRTVYRDLGTLALAGVPVRYVPERRGYQLAPEYQLVVPRLDVPECLALVVAVHASHAAPRLGLGPLARSALDRLLQALPAPLREQAQALCAGLPPPAHAADDRRTPPTSLVIALLEAIASRRTVEIELRSTRAPHRLIPVGLTEQAGEWHVQVRAGDPHTTGSFPLADLLRLRPAAALPSPSTRSGELTARHLGLE